MRYRLTIAYDGTAYHGWQRQLERRSLQQTIEEAIERMTGERVNVAASGRTDAGVHAAGQVVAFDLQEERAPERLRMGINHLTPGDISVIEAHAAVASFDPRRWATGRRYEYTIWNASWESPFFRRYVWRLGYALDVDAMREAAAALLGEHDFTSFRAAGCDAKSPVRAVRRSEFEVAGERIRYTIEATAFLHHMVRNIVGTLVQVGRRRRSAGSMASLLASRDRKLAGPTAPARGLSLVEVEYAGDRGDGIVDPQAEKERAG